MAGNHKTQVRKRCSRRRVRQPDLGASGGIGRKILRPASSGGGAPCGPARVAFGWPEVPRLVRSSTARRWLLGPNGVLGLESFLLGFWDTKSVWGLGFHLESQTMFI